MMHVHPWELIVAMSTLGPASLACLGWYAREALSPHPSDDVALRNEKEQSS